MCTENKIFTPEHTDYDLSPYTGMDRQSWIEAAEYLMNGFFSDINSEADPPLVRRSEFMITYPHRGVSEEQLNREKKAEVFEGLTRSLFIASALICNDPDIRIRGISLREYYKRWILEVVNQDSQWYVGSYESMQATCEDTDPFRTFQQTVETGALVIGLWVSRDQIWNQLDESEKDLIAAFLKGWGESSTVPQNWRLFNMLDLSFLSMNGYEIDEKIMYEHAAAILNYMAGDGWYRDGQSFDFYSTWGFSFYVPLWCRWWGDKNAPDLAAQFEEYTAELMKTYADMFDADGYVLLWGRSSIYRNAATCAFAADFFLDEPTADPGIARRISSGSLLQFLKRDDFLTDGNVPSIGFYGPFYPLVQGYSCAESVYWLGKAFLCLALPEDSAFWTAKENNGTWENYDGAVKTTVLDGPALAISDHIANGEVTLRTGKVVKDISDTGGMNEYAKLCYNSKYPWEAGESSAEEYVLNYGTSEGVHSNVTLWRGEIDGILYRRKFFEWDVKTEAHWTEAIDLADFAVPLGIIRCDRLRLLKKPVTVTLGSFGFPDNGTVEENREQKTADGKVKARAIILTGIDHMGKSRQIAMTVWDAFDGIRASNSVYTNPDSDHSIVLEATVHLYHHYDATEPHVLVSQVITREDGNGFSDEELFPIKEIKYTDHYGSGAYGPVSLVMNDGSVKTVSFDKIEGHLCV